MAGQNIYSERCVCGATIQIAECFSFISHEKMAQQFKQWQAKHRQCLPLFVEIQKARLGQVEIHNQKLIAGGTNEIS